MGLFHRSTVASPSNSHSFVDVIQNEGNNTGRGLIAWRHHSTDFNTHSKLLVRRGEEAVFENGASEWAIFPGGTEYELETQNIAVIRSFREALSGEKSYFPCRVYFISTEEFEVPWGTDDPVGFTCPLIGEGAQLRGGGIYVIRVIDSETFVKKVLRDNESYTITDFQYKLFQRIYQKVAAIISNTLEESRINSFECSKKKDEIAEQCKPRIQELLKDYGIMLIDFTVSLELDEKQKEMYEEENRRITMRAQGKAKERLIAADSKVEELQKMGSNYTTIKGMDIMESIANNPDSGGISGIGAGLGMGMAAAGAFGNLAQTAFGGIQTPAQQIPQPQPTAQPDPMESLKKLKQMLDAGLIPQSTYDQKVAEILSRL